MAKSKKKSSEKELRLVWGESMQLLNDAQEAYWDERQQCLNDRRFVTIDGAMWEDALGKQFENKPRMQVNKLMSSVDKTLAEMRRNPVTVKFVPKDGTNANDFAAIVSSMYRADEQDSMGHEAYQNASADAVMGGIGFYRLIAQYEKEFAEDGPQRIRFEPIVDGDSSVFFDLGSKRKDKSDARHCWVLTSMPLATFKVEYPDRTIEPTDVEKNVYSWNFDWFTPSMVVIAEHYRVEKIVSEVQTWLHVSGNERDYMAEEFERDPKLLPMLEKEAWTLQSKREVKTRVIHKYIEDGTGVIEDCGIIAGKYIPIIPQYGKRYFIDNLERVQGIVRLGKDIQRLLNMEISRLAELAATTGYEKPVFAAAQIAAHRDMWERDAVENFPYLLAEPLKDASGNIVQLGPIAMTKSPTIPPALAQIYQQTQMDMKDVMGMDMQAMTVQSNVSGEAVKLIIDQLSLYALGYMQERADARKYGGVVYYSMACEVYTEKNRKMKTVDTDGTVGSVEIGGVMMQGGVAKEFELREDALDVTATTEPAMISQKAELTRSLLGLLQYTQDPQISRVLQLEIIKNAEGSELSGIQKWARTQLVESGVEPPTPDEAAALQEKLGKPSQQDIALAAYAEKQKADAELAKANIAKVQSEVKKNLASIAQIEADIAAQAGSMQQSERESLMNTLTALRAMFQENLVQAQQQEQALIAQQQQMAQTPSAEAPQGASTFGDQIGRGIGQPKI